MLPEDRIVHHVEGAVGAEGDRLTVVRGGEGRPAVMIPVGEITVLVEAFKKDGVSLVVLDTEVVRNQPALAFVKPDLEKHMGGTGRDGKRVLVHSAAVSKPSEVIAGQHGAAVVEPDGIVDKPALIGGEIRHPVVQIHLIGLGGVKQGNRD